MNFINNPKEYNRLNHKRKRILAKLQDKLDRGIMYENFGQDEIRKFADICRANDNLTYKEQCMLIEALDKDIDNAVNNYEPIIKMDFDSIIERVGHRA